MSTMMRFADLAQYLPDAQLEGDGSSEFVRVHTDTRSIEPGDLFVALKGDHYDANDFLLQAKQRGAAGALCHASADRSQLTGMPCLLVADTRQALALLAQNWREKFRLPLLTVVGSNGKTTVTQMTASILAARGASDTYLATQGNLNNDIGVPLTVLRLRSTHQIGVVELGMNHPGEIATLAAIAQPTVAIITNAQREHLEYMQTVSAVAEENGSVIAAMPKDGVVVLPLDDSFTERWVAMAGARRVVRFGMAGLASPDTLVCQSARWVAGAWDVHAHGMGVQLHYRLAIAGRHNVKNSVAAAAAALVAQVPAEAVIQGLQAFLPVKGRSRAVSLGAGQEITLVDDTYNANPDSVRAAIDVLAELPAPRLLILGDMGEVGVQGPHFHQEAGQYASSRGIEYLMTLGELAQLASEELQGGQHFADVESLIAAAQALLPQLRSVLVKGSRFMRMERVVLALSQTPFGVQTQQENPCY